MRFSGICGIMNLLFCIREDDLMQQILTPNASILTILRKVKPSQEPYRMMKYCIQQPTEDGTLLFNVATRELLLLSQEEFARVTELPELRDRWFAVPESFNEKASVDTLRWVLENTGKKKKNITGYTILTTTDCNARCFYCYELGRSRIPMSEETAHKAAACIRDRCGGEAVNITWFGGEPLFNQPAMDTICRDLREFGISFTSSAVSNAYLFDEAAVKKAGELWNLQKVQVSLDGTEDVYNKSKAFIYREGSAYQVVLSNIGRLLDAGIKVTVRLNFDLYNAADLETLVEELAQRFGKKEGFSVYAHHLFEESQTMKDIHESDQWQTRYDALHKLEDKMEALGISGRAGIKNKLRLHHCMADNDACVTIVPTGHMGVCEHHSEDEFIGHVDTESLDGAVRAQWKERSAPIPECDCCPYYPDCIFLKKCSTNNACFPQYRQSRLNRLKKAMLEEYKKWKSAAEAL